jgi:hypothetical protein
LVCDICDNAAPEPFMEFMDAVDYKKSEGWGSFRHNEYLKE